MKPACRSAAQICLITIVCGVAGCSRPKPVVSPAPDPEVVVELPAKLDVTDYEVFTGRTAASKVVDVRARVTGHLVAIHFKDGDEVKKNQDLFDLDPGLYVAELERAKAAVEQVQARVIRLERDNDRNNAGGTSISQQEKDRVVGDLAEARAQLKVNIRQQEQAQINVNFLHIVSPIAGRISKRNIDIGNLVKADETLLTTIIDQSLIYVNFDIDDKTELRVKRLIEAGAMKPPGQTTWKVDIGLPDNDGYAFLGAPVTFEEPQFNSGTGTKRFRAELTNPRQGLLSPNLFVRVRVPIGEKRKALLVPEEAIGTDQTQRYVFIVNADHQVVYRQVVPGIQWGRYRVVRFLDEAAASDESGKASEPVLETDRVIVSGIQRVRAGVKVVPRLQTSPPAQSTPQTPTTTASASTRP